MEDTLVRSRAVAGTNCRNNAEGVGTVEVIRLVLAVAQRGRVDAL